MELERGEGLVRKSEREHLVFRAPAPQSHRCLYGGGGEEGGREKEGEGKRVNTIYNITLCLYY